MAEDREYGIESVDDRRRSRSSSRKSKKKRKKSSRSRSRSPRHASRSRSRRSRRSRSRSHRPPPRPKSPVIDPLEEEKARREAEEREANRDLYTVFVSQIHPRVDERDLFEFFSHVGRVEDIRLIRDQRTYKSKGLAYVEFWEKDCVNKAIALTGQALGGYPITVQITPSIEKKEENRPMRLYVGSLHFNVTEKDLRPVFEAFGPLDSIEIHKDANTGKSRGFGFVTYKNEADARAALSHLNGLPIADRPIKVGIVSEGKEAQSYSDSGGMLGELDEGSGGLALTAQSRVQLMQKLQRGNEMAPYQPPGGPSGMSAGPYNQQSAVVSQAQSLPVPRIQPSTCVVIKNMFDPKEEKDPDFDLELKEDVEEEVAKYGRLKHIFVDKNSPGNVYLRFQELAAAQGCVDALNGRWFASRKILAEFIVEPTYLLKFPSAK